MTQQNWRRVPGSPPLSLLGEGKLIMSRVDHKELELKAQRMPGPANSSCSQKRQFFFVPRFGFSCLLVCGNTEDSSRNSNEGRSPCTITVWRFDTQKCLIMSVRSWKIHLLLPKHVLGGVFVDPGEMAEGLRRTCVALAKDQSLIPRILLVARITCQSNSWGRDLKASSCSGTVLVWA